MSWLCFGTKWSASVVLTFNLLAETWEFRTWTRWSKFSCYVWPTLRERTNKLLKLSGYAPLELRYKPWSKFLVYHMDIWAMDTPSRREKVYYSTWQTVQLVQVQVLIPCTQYSTRTNADECYVLVNDTGRSSLFTVTSHSEYSRQIMESTGRRTLYS